MGVVRLAAALALLLACGPPDLSQGVWLSEDSEEVYALTFDQTGGLVTGTMHHLVEGKLFREWGFAGTRSQSDTLELSWGDNNTMSATVDLDLGEIRGSVILNDGVMFESLLRRRKAADIPGFEALPELPYRLRSPAPGSSWEVAEPEEVGLSPRHLESTVQAFARGEAGVIHSIIAVRHGKLVLEEYFHGYGRDDLHDVQSVTKSVTSLLVGIAHDRGAIGGLDTSVVEWFPEHREAAQPGWERVTLVHLLTMTAGLDWERREAERASPGGPELFEEIFQRRVAHEPGTRWLYNNADIELFGGILRRATGMHADELAAEALFAPLGITEWDWEWGRTGGYPALSGALNLRPLDMAKVGQLVLDGGRWKGQQVISEEWIEESTSPRLATNGGSQRYGYLWVRLDAPLDAGPHPVITATGSGSQFIHIVPALDAVIVTTGGNHLNGKTFTVDEVLLRELVPGIAR